MSTNAGSTRGKNNCSQNVTYARGEEEEEEEDDEEEEEVEEKEEMPDMKQSRCN